MSERMTARELLMWWGLKGCLPAGTTAVERVAFLLELEDLHRESMPRVGLTEARIMREIEADNRAREAADALARKAG
jgi:hypothetical protein